MSRFKNQHSIDYARKLEKELGSGPRGKGWRAWQTTVGKILTVNGYAAIHLPQLPTKALNQRLPAGLPDWIGIGREGTSAFGTIIVVECKSGKATTTAKQNTMLRCLLAVPGVRGGVFYPHDRAELVKLAGGQEIGG